MSPRARRIVIPLIVLGFAVGIAVSVVTHRAGRHSAERAAERAASVEAQQSADPQGPATAPGSTDPAREPGSEDGSGAGAVSAPSSDTPEIAAVPPPSAEKLAGWRAVAPAGTIAERGGLAPLGSVDPTTDRLRIDFAPRAAGIEQIVFSDYWETARARRAVVALRRAGEPIPPELDAQRYVLQRTLNLDRFAVPLLAMHSLEVEGQRIGLFGDVWSPDGPSRLLSEVRDADGVAVLRVGRSFALRADGYGIEVGQWIENLTDAPLTIRLVHYGPPDLRLDRDRYIDIRRYHFGYVMPGAPVGRPPTVVTDGQMITRADVLKQIERRNPSLWPNADSERAGLTLSWYGTTNRYFSMAIHPPADAVTGGARTIGSIEQVLAARDIQPDSQPAVLTEVRTPTRVVDAGTTARFDTGIYAGPLDPSVLGAVQPYEALGMAGLILYLMSDCCTMCTFPWLAKLLLTFLSFIHDYLLHDWALSIIALVLVVRILLHPLMKRSQIQMQRFGRAMSELKPEIERLQQKHKGDPKRLQAEQLRLYREKGVSPIGCIGGIVPTLLQMPIWIALYAMLYFAFELRHQPAFFGVFQLFNDWPFLSDLSASDHFFWEFENAHSVFGLWNVTGINLIPILMGLVFFFQQKYMTPPTTVPLSPEQQQQQKLMKIMMVVMFPLMLYSAPSGLTLYIMTSSLIGIFESRQIRKHIARLDEAAKVAGPKPKKKQDMLGRMYEQALDRARERAANKKRPPRKFKERGD